MICTVAEIVVDVDSDVALVDDAVDADGDDDAEVDDGDKCNGAARSAVDIGP